MYRKEKLQESIDAEYALMIKKRYPTSYVVAQKWHKHSSRTGTIECYDHYTTAYWKSRSFVNLKTLYLGISKATKFMFGE